MPSLLRPSRRLSEAPEASRGPSGTRWGRLDHELKASFGQVELKSCPSAALKSLCLLFIVLLIVIAIAIVLLLILLLLSS